jgi:hypothetical protein
LIGLAAGVGSLALQHRGVILLGAVEVTFGLVGERALAIGRDQHAAWRRHDVDRRFCFCEPDRFGRISDGTIEVALGAPDHRAAGQGLRQFRIEPDRFVDVGQRAIEIAERAFRSTAVLPGKGRGRAELDRLIVVGDRLGVFTFGAPGIAAVVKDDAARRPHPQRVVEVGDGDVVLALVVVGRAAQIVEGDAGVQADRFAGVRDYLVVVAFLVPADRAPEIDGRELLAGKHLQRDDLVAGVDHLIGRRGVGGAERPKLVARLGEGWRRPQGGGEQGKYQDCAAHQVPVNGGRE